MNLNNPYLRFLAGIVAVAVTIRLVAMLLAPVLPELILILIAAVVWRLWIWHRDRW